MIFTGHEGELHYIYQSTFDGPALSIVRFFQGDKRGVLVGRPTATREGVTQYYSDCGMFSSILPTLAALRLMV